MTLAIGAGQAVAIIAEIGVNHQGSLDTALRLVDAAVKSGAQAIKCQVWSEHDNDPYAHLRLGRADLLAIQHATQAAGLEWFATPDDCASVGLLEAMGVGLYKVGSAGLANVELLRAVGATGKPVLMSTGAAGYDEIKRAIQVLPPCKLTLLHCVSCYPTPPDQSNLRRMQNLWPYPYNISPGPVGLSSHYPASLDAIAAVAMGAKVIEKHLTLSRDQPGPDHAASMEPPEFASMVQSIRLLESMMGSGQLEPQPCEANLRREVWGE